MNFDGSNIINISDNKNYCENPSWSRKNDKIIYSVNDEDKKYYLSEYNLLNNTTKEILFQEKPITHPFYSQLQ